jgi:hypothetical protein
MKAKILLVFLCFFVLPSCAGLKLNLRNSSVQKPSNVALYFSVETREGLPVPGLTAESFRIYEDDRLISPFESKQTILNPEVTVVSYIVLLLDMSGSITESGSLPALIDAAGSFAERITRKHHVAVYGFDGGAELIPVVDFSTSHAAVQRGLSRLSHKRAKDPSTNLNGAVVESVKVLEKQMSRSKQPLRFGTLVIFTDGTDRAHRVTEDAMFDVLDEASVNVFVIGVGGEISVDQLAKLGRTGFVQAAEMTAISTAFDDVAALIEAAGKKFYLLSYCSPARAGTHTLKVEVETAGRGGSLDTPFNADGFGPKCDPGKKPVFSVGRIRIR